MGGVIVVKAVVEQGKGARLYCERIITKFLQVLRVCGFSAKLTVLEASKACPTT